VAKSVVMKVETKNFHQYWYGQNFYYQLAIEVISLGNLISLVIKNLVAEINLQETVIKP